MNVGISRLFKGHVATVDLPPGPWRAVYPWRVPLTLTWPDGNVERLKAGEGRTLGRSACRIGTDDPEAGYFLWEIDGPGKPGIPAPAGLAMLLSHEFTLPPDPDAPNEAAAVVRFERVDLHRGVVTPRHTHLGSGLRVLIDGYLEAEIDGVHSGLHPGDAWLEKGPGEAVIGRAATDCRTAFVRLLVLPPSAEGVDSFVLLEPAGIARPRPAAYARFHEERIVL